MGLSAQVGRYIEGLEVGQGRHAGEWVRLLGWQRRFLAVTLVVGLALLTVSPVVLAQSSSDAVSETTQPPRAERRRYRAHVS